PRQRAATLDAVLSRLERTPGMASVTAVDGVPLTNNSPITPIDMRTGDHVDPVYTNHVSPGLFNTLGIPLVAGGDFTAADSASPPAVATATKTLAPGFWRGEAALGRRLQTADGKTIEIIGIARDAKYESVTEPPRAFLYRPMAQTDLLSPT